jgi:hypothetical protein
MTQKFDRNRCPDGKVELRSTEVDGRTVRHDEVCFRVE